jgi:hypothetical protein
MLCRDQVAELRPHVSALRAAGGELVIVGSGAPHFAKAFGEDLGLGDVPIFCDRPLRSYALAGFRRDVGSLLDPRVLLHGARALAHGQFQHRTQGDPLQQGGAMVIRPDGTVAYRYRSAVAGDHPKPAVLVAALEQAIAA